MHCAVCVRTIEVNLAKHNGIESVSVSLPSESASVLYDDSKISEKDIINIINKLGYKATLPDLNKNEDKNLLAEKRKLIISLFFSAILFLVAMGPMLGIIRLPILLQNMKIMSVLQIILTLPVIICGFRFYTSGFSSLFRKSPNMDTLVALGTLSAILYSLYSVVYIFIGKSTEFHKLYFESASMIISLVMLGKFLEKRATKKTSDAVRKLISLAPQTACVLRNDKEVIIPAREVLIGDTVIIRPGEKVSVDGTVIFGSSEVDESMLTGESLPVVKSIGDEIIGGCLNRTGFLRISATRVGEDTILSSIVKTVSEAQASKAPIARLADTVSGYFVPVVFGIAFVAAILWLIAGYDFSLALSVFISVLVISCPCALGLATPVAIMAGTGLAARCGILFRNGASLEHASKISAVVFDKTGTITTGKPVVTDIVSNIDKNELLSLAASCEKNSEHLLGKTIVSYASSLGISLSDAIDFEYTVGKGISATVCGKKIFVGNSAFCKNAERFEDVANTFSADGKTPIFVSDENSALGVIAVSDDLKPSAKACIEALKAKKIDVCMLTGDNEKTAVAIAKAVGIENVISRVSPNEKSETIKRLKASNKVVCMIGDGINDAPALASADVSVTVRSGTDIATEASDVVLMKDDLSDITKLIDISKAVTRNIKQNLFWAFAYNTVGIPVAAGLLHVFGGPFLNPMFGALAMSLSSITVISNALRLSRMKFK